jgi:hypothetical protein
MIIIGAISGAIAFKFVGRLYRGGEIHGRDIGSILYWAFSLFIWGILFTIASFVIWIVKAIMSIPLYVWFVILGTLFLGLLTFIIVKLKSRMSNTV